MSTYQPKTGEKCTCKRGTQRDNCPNCEGTGWVIDFAAIRARTASLERAELEVTAVVLVCPHCKTDMQRLDEGWHCPKCNYQSFPPGIGGGGPEAPAAVGGGLSSTIVWHPGSQTPDHDRIVLLFDPDQAMDPLDPCRTWPGWYDGEGWTFADGTAADPPRYWCEIPRPPEA